MLRRLAILAALLPQAMAAQPAPRAGEVYEIERVSEMRYTAGGAGEGNAYDRDTLIERVIAVREDGVELEYDLPSDATAEDRLREWQFPFRIVKPAPGPMRLLNGPELEARVDRWLTAAHWTRAQCGHWYFTWNAFQVQCDPASVHDIAAAFDLTGQELREGAAWEDPMGAAPAPLRREEAGGAAFVAEVAVDEEKALRAEARTEAVATEIMGASPELAAARAAHVPRRITGTIRVRFEARAGGSLRRIRVARLEIERANGERETRTTTETIERRPVTPRA